MKQKKRSFWKKLGIAVGIAAILFALFVVAFVFNPLEGSVRDVRDLVPREVQFFARKTNLAADFRDFPEPWFWSDFAASKTWEDLQKGAWVQGLRRDGLERSLQQARDGLQQVRSATGGFLDPLADIVGREVVMAGYFEDLSGAAPQPLAVPHWCAYARVSWKVRAGWGLSRWGLVQSQVQKGGTSIGNDGELLSIKLATGEQFWAARHLDCLMVANDKHIVEQSLGLVIGTETEQPFGQKAEYTEGVTDRIRNWVESTGGNVNALELSLEPNRFDRVRQWAGSWPNPADPESMNQRVLASFLNLKGWMRWSGALLFEPDNLSFLGQVVLNSHMHTAFQSSFFKAEQEPRRKWLDPFLQMVPQSACAAAALRMPAGDFVDRMYEALSGPDKDLLNEGVRRSPWEGQQLNDAREVIEKLKLALLPRTGFVFRRNDPDPEIPVADISPVPQVAWVFWLKPGCGPIVGNFFKWMRLNATTLGFKKVYHLKLNLSGESSAATENDSGEDVITEYTNPQIDGTGEIATLLFRDFFVVSNSGPLIKDMFWARYHVRGAESVFQTKEMESIERELPTALNGFVLVRGAQFGRLLDSYSDYAKRGAQEPDPAWKMQVRATAEDAVRKARFPGSPTVAAIPESQRAEFEQRVTEWMNKEWQRVGAGITADDMATVEQLRALSRGIDAVYMQVELENNFIRYQGRVMAGFR